MNEPYTLTRARYAKKSVAVRVHDSKGDTNGRSSRLCQALNARWSGRERAYIMSESKGRKFEQAFREWRGRAPRFRFDLFRTLRARWARILLSEWGPRRVNGRAPDHGKDRFPWRARI